LPGADCSITKNQNRFGNDYLVRTGGIQNLTFAVRGIGIPVCLIVCIEMCVNPCRGSASQV
jgi:hypothetical protein